MKRQYGETEENEIIFSFTSKTRVADPHQRKGIHFQLPNPKLFGLKSN
jgi:hypothetical protein